MSKPRKLCIFCGGYPITKEHVWPDWLGPHLPNDLLNHEVYSELILPTETLTKVTKRSGGPQRARVRHVCQACNNGWMSVLQNDAKQILIPLLQGDRISLFKNQRLILARWIVMFCMVAEFMDRSGLRIGISQEARTHLKEKGSVPPGWKIWIALLHQNARPSVWIHNTLPIEDIKNKIEITTNEEGIALPNSQTTTFAIGRMLVSTFSTPLPGLLRKQKMPVALVRQLWPLQDKQIDWPLPNTVSGPIAERIGTAVIEFAKRALDRREAGAS